jgi:hypothetical protein
LRQARPEEATRAFVRILQLPARHASVAIAAALEQALAGDCWSADGVAQYLQQARVPTPPLSTLDLTVAPSLAALSQVTIALPDRDCFNQLLSEVS